MRKFVVAMCQLKTHCSSLQGFPLPDVPSEIRRHDQSRTPLLANAQPIRFVVVVDGGEDERSEPFDLEDLTIFSLQDSSIWKEQFLSSEQSRMTREATDETVHFLLHHRRR